MKRELFMLYLLLMIGYRSPAQINRYPVFISGSSGYKIYRIPAIIQTPNGHLLAFCEGRVNGGSDFGDIDLVLKKSQDRGKSWGPLKIVVDNAQLQSGNPAPVVDLTDPDHPNGRIFLFYNTGNNHEGEIRKGNGVREVWYKTSVDQGETWSQGINITLQVHKPLQPGVSEEYRFVEDWRSYANTPGHALQINRGKYAGRIYVAANHSEGIPKHKFEDYHAHGYYTDDHGQTFHLSESISLPGSNESTAAQLSDDRLMINARNQQGDIRSRIIAISNDGGVNWDNEYFDPQLPDPVCEGSILNLGLKNSKQVLAFTNAADPYRRDKLTLRISMDEGLTWPKKLIIEQSSDATIKDFTAYSDIVRMDRSHVGLLYEREGYRQIVFTAINWKKL